MLTLEIAMLHDKLLDFQQFVRWNKASKLFRTLRERLIMMLDAILINKNSLVTCLQPMTCSVINYKLYKCCCRALYNEKNRKKNPSINCYKTLQRGNPNRSSIVLPRKLNIWNIPLPGIGQKIFHNTLVLQETAQGGGIREKIIGTKFQISKFQLTTLPTELKNSNQFESYGR